MKVKFNQIETLSKMKTIQLKFKTFLLMLLVGFAFASCSKDDDEVENRPPNSFTLNEVANAEDLQPKLTWKAATDPEGDNVSYQVYLDTQDPPQITIVNSLGVSSFTIENALEPETTYYWKVIAKDAEGNTTESAIASFTTNDPAIVNSLFKNNAEGWTIAGDAQDGYTEASYSPDEGVIEGFIFATDDITGGVWYFSAPDSYLGNKEDYYGATLKYSLVQNSAMSDQFEYEDIVFKNGDQQIYYEVSSYPTENWTPYSVKIDENSGWRYGTSEGENSTATKTQIDMVLSNITAFWIRGEFESGPDEGGLDNVKIITE